MAFAPTASRLQFDIMPLVDNVIVHITVVPGGPVSGGDASRALNGKANVSARARERVLKAAQELGNVASSSAYRLATAHLISLGHTKIGIISGKPSTEMNSRQPSLRKAGYHEGLLDANHYFEPHWVAESEFTVEGGYYAAKQMLGNSQSAPTATFCDADEMATRLSSSTDWLEVKKQGVQGASELIDIFESGEEKGLKTFRIWPSGQVIQLP